MRDGAGPDCLAGVIGCVSTWSLLSCLGLVSVEEREGKGEEEEEGEAARGRPVGDIPSRCSVQK